MHESIDRLQRLANDWPRVCLGSSGEYSRVGDGKWWGRMSDAMHAVCDRNGNPICKLHGLRMLSQYVFTHLQLASADSTSIARNVGVDSRWTGTYTPASKESRAAVMRNRIEAHQSLTFLSDDLRMAKTVQIGLFDLM